MAGKTIIRFRFTFNQRGKPKPRAGARRAVNAVIKDIAIRHAEGTFELVKREISDRVERDIQAEAGYMSGLIKRSVIGIGGSHRAPSGWANMSHEMAQVSSSLGIKKEFRAGTGISWAARSPHYLDWKQRHGFGQAWFRNRGATLGSFFGHSSTLVHRLGPVEVRIERPHNPGASGGTIRSSYTQARDVSAFGRVTYMTKEETADANKIRTPVCTIRVSAMGNITPQMLPALGSGKLGHYAPDGRTTGLLDLMPHEVRVRLAGPKNRPYRHTVEPFLSFFLTQAVPNALFLRVEQGLKTRLTRANIRGSLGR